MLKTDKRLRLKSSHILTVLFLAYIFYTGFSALPDFLIQTGNNLRWKEGPQQFIRSTNAQYEGMLTTEKVNPLLQNKGTYINLNGLLARSMGQPMMNDRVTLKNGHLTSLVPDPAAPEVIRSAADNVIDFYTRHTQNGGSFLFVMVSSQISKYEDLLPIGYTDTTNETADTFLSYLDAAGVPYLDLREEMHKEGISVTDAYFTTDHHWKPQTGFWAYGKILESLARMGAIGPVDSFYTNPENFIFQTYEVTFLGSWGKRTGKYYAGVDDSIFILPDFQTDISLTVPGSDINVRGPFEQICYNQYIVHNFEDPDFFQENAYGLYGWGDTPLSQWRNDQAPVQTRFLSIGESFGNVPFSLMSLYLSECDEMDMRLYTDNFSQYYETFAPNIILMEVNVDQLLGPITTSKYFSE